MRSSCLSAGLSLRSRYLSFLSKLPNLLKLFRLPKLSLFFVLLFLLLYTQGSMALTAYTSKNIEGTLPYFTFDGGRTKITNTDSLLFIKLQDGRVITPSTNISSVTNPIRLPYVGSTLGDIDMLIPSSMNSVSLSDLVTRYNYWGDDDGDGQGTNGITATGSISVSFTDKDGNTVSRSDSLSICRAPYKVTLSSTGGYLKTQYGLPNVSYFFGHAVSYYISPNQPLGACFARPNLYDNYGISASVWNSTKGFLTQSNDFSSYSLNFPTTGADGLYFDLEMPVEVNGSELTWSVVTNGSIRATVSWTKPRSGRVISPSGGSDADAWIRDKSSYVTRVTLNGPRASDTQIQSANPIPLEKPSLPQIFELVGRDNRGKEVKYGFVLQKWFVYGRSRKDSWSNQFSWCSSLGYVLPQVKDFTNAKCGVDNSNFPCRNGIDGATPLSAFNSYRRHIGAGFFTEWGSLSFYAIDIGFPVFDGYWTRDTPNNNVYFRVNSGNGFNYVRAARLSEGGKFVICSTP
ncbi:hypothetical protein GYX25_03890 [Gilliamella sp. ESL0254]|nr:hypothetical protein [Gilliamella sp. ESL0254]